MKFVYFTSQKYPSKKTEPFFWKSMAKAFERLCGADFVFVVRNTPAGALPVRRALSVLTPKRFLALFYFLAFPRLVRSHGWDARDVVFFAQDPYLLAILVFWRSIFRYSYRVASDWHQLFGDWRDRYVARRSDWLITTSKRLREKLIERTGVPAEKVRVAYGGVDLALFEKKRAVARADLRRKLQLPPEATLVGYIGAFVSVAGEKGLSTMIEALAGLPPEYRMVFAGDRAGQGERYRAQAERLGVADRCVFLPWLPYEAYAECQIAIDVLVIPYPDEPHYRDQGFPMKVWEYLAAGRPIVYADLEVIAEVLKGRGEAFTPGDPRSLVEAVMRAQGGEEQAAHNARDVRAYSWDARAARIVGAVQENVH